MSNDTLLPPSQATPSSHRPVWSALTRWWSPAAAPAEAELGYESAHPWTLGDEVPADTSEVR